MTGARNPVRVAVNALHAKTGGGLTYLRSVLPLIAEDREIELHLIVHRSQTALLGEVGARIHLHAFDYSPRFAAELLWEQFVLPGALKRLGIDVVFSPANFGPLLPTQTVVLLRNALAVGERETRPSKRLYWAALGLMTKLSVLRSREAIAVSKYAAATLTAGLPASVQRKVSVVYHGVRPHFSQAAAMPDRGDFVLAVGDLYIQKNLLTLITAMADVRRTFPRIHLKVAGRIVDEDHYSLVQAEIARHALTGAVEFLGAVAEESLITLYRKCRLFVFPSTVETFGHPLVEAMACGAPVASSRTTAMPEVLGDAGRYFDPLDSADMARCIAELYGDDTLCEELGRRGRERAALFSLERTARETAQVLKRAARG